MTPDITTEMDSILGRFDPADPAATAAALERLWLEFEPQDLGSIKAGLKRDHKMVGIPIPVLRAIAKPWKKAASKHVPDHMPLARLLWDHHGREGRNIALIALGGMELKAPRTVVPLLFELCRCCATWEDADRMAMDALEPIVRKHPDEWLPALHPWLDDDDRWRRRVAVTVVGRLPMKHPETAARCLAMIAPLLPDTREEVRKATSFAIRLAARGDATEVASFLDRHVPPTDPAATWVLCDAIRSMARKLLPTFTPLLPNYEAWAESESLAARDRRSVESAVKTLRMA
jgi:hypothetical protein